MAVAKAIPLDRYLRARGPLPPGKVARLACEVVRQLESELSPGSDVRPAAIRPSRLVVAGDGSVRVLPAEPGEDERFLRLSLPAYASPEEALGRRGDFRSQYYSLGCTIFELLTGRPPFQGDDARTVLRAHLREPIPDPAASIAGVDPALGKVVHDLLFKDPDHRLHDFRALLARLETTARARAGAPVKTAAVTSPETGTSAAVASSRTKKAGPAGEGSPAAPRGAPRAAGREPAGERRAPGGAAAAARSAKAPASPAAPRGSDRRTAAPGAGGGAGSSRRGERGSTTIRLAGQRGGERPRAGSTTLRKGVARRGRDPDAAAGDASGLPEEEVRRRWPFALSGAAAGVIGGALVVLLSSGPPPQEPVASAEEQAAETARARRDAFDSEVQQDQQIVARTLEAVRTTVVDRSRRIEERRNDIVLRLDRISHLPGAVNVAQELARLEAGEEAISEQAKEAWQELARSIEAVRGEERLGEALRRLRAVEDEHPGYQKEIDELIADLSRELEERWKTDGARLAELTDARRYDEARELITRVKQYGDAPIREEADRYIQKIERALTGQATAAPAPAPGGADEEVEALIQELGVESVEVGGDG